MRSFLVVTCCTLIVLLPRVICQRCQDVNGWLAIPSVVSRSQCGAEECTKKCITAGASPVLLRIRQRVWQWTTLKLLKNTTDITLLSPAHRRRQIHVDSVKML